MPEGRPEKSLRWMVTMLAVAVLLLGWAFAAAAYSTEVEGWGYAGPPRGMVTWGIVRFLVNAVIQIPNCVRVLSYTVSEKIVFVVLLVVAEAGVLLFGRWAAQIEKQHAAEDRRARRGR